MPAEPHMYKKFRRLVESYDHINRNFEAVGVEFRRELARKFRLTKDDVRKILREMPEIERINQRKIKIR